MLIVSDNNLVVARQPPLVTCVPSGRKNVPALHRPDHGEGAAQCRSGEAISLWVACKDIEWSGSQILGLLSAEEMNVSIITCAPLKKSPNCKRERASGAEILQSRFPKPVLPRWGGWSDVPN